MKLTKLIVATVIIALTLAGCYWTPPQAQSGGVSFNVSLPRGVVSPGVYTEAFRVYLYDSADVKALYGFPPSNPTPAYRSDDIGVNATGSPIQIDGYDYYDVVLSQPPSGSGSFTIPDVLPGRKYRVHMLYGSYEPSPYFWGYYEGVSEAFEVAAGSVVDVALDLYYSYYGFSYGSPY